MHGFFVQLCAWWACLCQVAPHLTWSASPLGLIEHFKDKQWLHITCCATVKTCWGDLLLLCILKQSLLRNGPVERPLRYFIAFQSPTWMGVKGNMHCCGPECNFKLATCLFTPSKHRIILLLSTFGKKTRMHKIAWLLRGLMWTAHNLPPEFI